MSKKTQGGYSKPNYTQIPNELLEVHLPKMKEAELKVVLAIARATFGWHKEKDKLSLSQLMERTGLTRQGVVNGIQDGIERGIIHREESGMGFFYSLIFNDELVNEVDQLTDEVVNKIDQSTKKTSQPNRPELVNEVDQLDAKLVNEVDTQKKEIKESKRNTSATRQSKKSIDGGTAESEQQKQLVKDILAAYVEVRGSNGINYAKEGAWAKKIAKEGATIEMVKACYEWIKLDKFWEFKPVSLAKVCESLPEFKRFIEKRGTPKVENPAGEWVIRDLSMYEGGKMLVNTKTGEKRKLDDA